ncbi:MAG: pYEATS domain-containing protein [Planctomycetota bacterium]
MLRTDFSGLSVFRDGDILAGARWTDVWKEELENCDLALVFYGHSWFDGTMPEAWPLEKFALFLAARDDVTVIPVACRGVPFRMLPLQLLERSGLSLDTLFPNVRYPEGPDGFQLGRELSKRLTPLLDVEGILSSSATTSSRPDPEDPHKGQFGGLAKRNGTELTTKIADVRGAEDWWRITLVVTVEPNSGIEGSVTFHLHPTFSEPRITVPICSGRAELLVFAWDAFTAGAELDSGRRRLELDPGTLPDAPSVFRERWSDTSETESFIP